MLKQNAFIIVAALAISSSAYAAQSKPDIYPPETKLAMALRLYLWQESKLAHHVPHPRIHPRPRRYKRRNKPHASITISL